MLAVGSLGYGRVHLVDAATGIVRWEVDSGRDMSGRIQVDRTKVIMSRDGRFVASVSDFEENWKLWDAASGVLCMSGDRHDGTKRCTCTATRNGLRTSLDEECPVQAHTTGLRAVAISGQRLATAGGEDRQVILWDALTGKAEYVMLGHSDRVEAVTFSADGARLASGSADLSIRVWDAITGTLLRTLEKSHASSVCQVQFSPTENRILASTVDGDTQSPAGVISFARVKVWDVDSGEMMSSFAGHCLAVFSPDGRTIATVRGDWQHSLCQIHNVESGEVLVRIAGEAGWLCHGSFSVDGSRLALGISTPFVGNDGNTCRVFDSSTGEVLRNIELGATLPPLPPKDAHHNFFSVAWGRDWVMDTERAMAFAMGYHPRLGVGSQLQGLVVELVRMIMDYA